MGIHLKKQFHLNELASGSFFPEKSFYNGLKVEQSARKQKRMPR
nr:MAG TPA: hypothetical protein [Caudoviricetes sp.]